MKYVDYSGLYRILANLKAWIKSVFVSNVTVSGRTISVTKNDQTTSTDLSYPAASDSAAGVTKLYSGLGTNQDGAMTQKRITELINAGFTFMGIASPNTPLPLELVTLPDSTLQKKFWIAVTPGTYKQNTLIEGQTSDIGTVSASEFGVITMQDVSGNCTYAMSKGSLALPTAGASVAGIAKLYSTLGQATDGPVTQKIATDLFNAGWDFRGEVDPVGFVIQVADEPVSGVISKKFFFAKTAGTYTKGQLSVTLATGEIAFILHDAIGLNDAERLVKITLLTVEQSTGQSTTNPMSQKAATDTFFQKANIITNSTAGITGDNDKVASDKELNARLAQIRQEMAQIGGFSTAYSTLASLEAAAEAGQLDARKIYLIPLDEEGPSDVYAEYILMTASGQLYKCDECGYIYNPDKGDPDHSVPPGTPFTDLPNDWVCPECENTQDNFTAISGYVERIGSTSLDMDAITNAEIDQAFVDNGMVPANS